jgi:hypothetical protein
MEETVPLDGAIDVHTHVGPSPFDRRVDGFECAMEVANAGMDGVVLKEHHLPTTASMSYIDRLLAREGADVDVIGSAVLNYCNGGFNPFVVQSAIDADAGVVWGPTLDARNHAKRTGELGAFLGVDAGREYERKTGITALDGDGDLREDVRLCIEKVVDGDVVLALGHLSNEETFVITEYAADLGHEKVLIDHPEYPVTDLDGEQQVELVSLGATLNFPFLSVSAEYGWSSTERVADRIRSVGVENCVVSSDVGQSTTPSAPEGLRSLGRQLLDEGFSAADFETLTRTNPKRLLGTA